MFIGAYGVLDMAFDASVDVYERSTAAVPGNDRSVHTPVTPLDEKTID